MVFCNSITVVYEGVHFPKLDIGSLPLAAKVFFRVSTEAPASVSNPLMNPGGLRTGDWCGGEMIFLF